MYSPSNWTFKTSTRDYNSTYNSCSSLTWLGFALVRSYQVYREFHLSNWSWFFYGEVEGEYEHNILTCSILIACICDFIVNSPNNSPITNRVFYYLYNPGSVGCSTDYLCANRPLIFLFCFVYLLALKVYLRKILIRSV